MTHEHDTCGGPCAVSFDEQRRRALNAYRAEVGTYPADAAWALERQMSRIDAAEKDATRRDEEARLDYELRRDVDAVAKMACAMHEKLKLTRERRGGWWTDGCTVEKLSQMLHAVVAKGDPVDVANYCAFIAAKGGKIAPISTATAEGLKALDNAFDQVHSDPAHKTDEYLRAYANGIILAHSYLHGTKPEFFGPSGAVREVVKKESADRPAGWCEPYGVDRSFAATDHAKTEERAMKAELLGPELGDTTEAVNVPEPTVSIGRLVPRMPADAPMMDRKRELAPAIREGSSLLRPATSAAQIAAVVEFAGELNKARQKFPTMASAHEGFAIIAEELDELKAIVWQKQSERNYAELRKETVQLGAMVLAFLLEVVNPENRR